MGWRILYIEEAISVKLYLDNIRIEKETGFLTIPLLDIHTIVIDNQMISITIPLIVKCSEYNINLVVCSIEHMPKASVISFNGNYQTPLILKKQIMWDEITKQCLHKLLIKNKIENQTDLLKHYNKNSNSIAKMVELASSIEIGDVTNREGLTAKIYFRALYGSDFKRFDDDVINAGLNYGYAILRSQISKSIIAKGLHPSLGIIHKGANNFFNLSDDIIEVFRPIIDEYVYLNLVDALFLTKQNRIELIRCTTKDCLIKNQRQSVFNTIEIYIEKIINVFETGDLSGYETVRLIYGV